MWGDSYGLHIWTSQSLVLSNVHLDGSTRDFSLVQSSNTCLSLLIGRECEDCMFAPAKVVEVSHLSKLLNSIFEVFIAWILGRTEYRNILNWNRITYPRHVVDGDLSSLFDSRISITLWTGDMTENSSSTKIGSIHSSYSIPSFLWGREYDQSTIASLSSLDCTSDGSILLKCFLQFINGSLAAYIGDVHGCWLGLLGLLGLILKIEWN